MEKGKLGRKKGKREENRVGEGKSGNWEGKRERVIGKNLKKIKIRNA